MMHATIDGQYELWQTDDKQFNEIIKYYGVPFVSKLEKLSCL